MNMFIYHYCMRDYVGVLRKWVTARWEKLLYTCGIGEVDRGVASSHSTRPLNGPNTIGLIRHHVFQPNFYDLIWNLVCLMAGMLPGRNIHLRTQVKSMRNVT